MNRVVLFVCVENSARSQMAEAFFNHHNNNPRFIAMSAGTNPTTSIKPQVITVMKEKGIDISNQKPKPLTPEMLENAHLIITLGCMQGCPATPAEKTIDWNLEDPAGRPLNEFRRIRDEIEKRVQQLIKALE